MTWDEARIWVVGLAVDGRISTIADLGWAGLVYSATGLMVAGLVGLGEDGRCMGLKL